MKAAIIAPTNLLTRYAVHTDYHLVLAHLIISDETYLNYYRKRKEAGDYIILDNSIIELKGQPMKGEDLKKAVELLQPDEFVLQDYPQDPKATYVEAYEGGQYWKEKHPSMKLMAVPQWYPSKHLSNWMDSLYDLAALEWVDCIGIPKFLKDSRPMAVAQLNLNYPDKEYHLLGTWGNPIEVVKYTAMPWIRGIDTKAPVRFGLYGVVLHPKAGLLMKELRDTLPELQMQTAYDPLPVITSHNIKTFLSWLQPSSIAEVVELKKVNS